ncbi:transporter substrate-binding domain-containing protein [Proteiniclasticum sp.]|uniref:transporter substrate-binding domain-containing protein n=1 Tax=Proteiniclasticum sp. TaxID=2053595 RepID=UPI00289D8756|nr:transporter substrate-binding domain-containing protein [Proteiniclasticum sp.]
MKKTGLKKALILTMALTSLLSFAACASKEAASEGSPEAVASAPLAAPEVKEQTPLEKIKEKGTLVLGTSADYPPYEFHASINGKDEIVGFDIEIGKEIAKDLGVELVIKDMKFDGLLAALDQGNIDIVIAGMSPTPERAENVDFSQIYYQSLQTVVVRAEDKDVLTSADSLKGKKIGVQKGAIQETIASEQFPGASPVALGKITDLILSLNSGRIDSAIIEYPVAKSGVVANPGLFITEIPIEMEDNGTAIALKKDSGDYLEAVNKTLTRLLDENLVDKFVADATLLAEEQQEN